MGKIKFEATKDNFSQWYTDIIIQTQLLSYYDVSGCYIMLPDACAIWDEIRLYLDKLIKKIGVRNVYFPLLITEKNLKREESHLEGFTPEVIWIANCDEQNKLAIRPTSECGMYSTFAELIRSHQDLPLLWNQWANVMRWEVSDPTPFIRSKEFLWQEGHCAFKSNEETEKHIETILEIYRNVYTKLLCVPVIAGKKTESEKFAGANDTYTLETFIPEAKRSIQTCTVHNLGQNFSKMFDIKFQTESGETQHCYQSSWGLTTRSIGVTIMTHSDNKGLVLPPLIAPVQIVIIPIIFTKDNDINQQIEACCNNLYNKLKDSYKVVLDNTSVRPGQKYYWWEAKGVPLRIEIGPKDVLNNSCVLITRHDSKKTNSDQSLIEPEFIKNMFEIMAEELYQAASNKLTKSIVHVASLTEIQSALDTNKLPNCFLCSSECEKAIRKDFGVKPIVQKQVPIITIESDSRELIKEIVKKENHCIVCDKMTTNLCYISRTF